MSAGAGGSFSTRGQITIVGLLIHEAVVVDLNQQ